MSRSHAIVIGWRRSSLAQRYAMIPPATILAGKCISCGDEVYVNELGASAFRDRDADPCCEICERRYHADINRSMIES